MSKKEGDIDNLLTERRTTEFRPINLNVSNTQNTHLKKILKQHFKKEVREHSIDDEL